MRSSRALWIGFAAGALALAPVSSVLAHGGHAAQPISVIDPIIAHHALLEDELKLNLMGERVFDVDRSTAMGSLELAYAIDDTLGVEAFIPFGAIWDPAGLSGGVGDIELQIPKVSFLREYGLVMTAYVALTLPTRAPPSSIGAGAWVAAPHVLIDIGAGPVGVQGNAAVEASSSGELAVELRGALSYSLLLGGAGPDILSFVLEGFGDVSVLDAEAFVAGLAGARLSLGPWSIALGAAAEVAGAAPFDLRIAAQLGCHVSQNRTARAPRR